ncbi:Diaminopimelate epimerase-like protein [Aulographum hederae CBS 113979]|uniref:trans-L-3-hydroxyproline dehydratase n=1 Tax=Aulographum hederae CBS 113979 TaxID=1176131 RepID=A0A6G1GZ99_9PEZI|nr:Diaminopimelate epimerase-like protein [Aulographum hederae CBS 113979]
MHTTGEPTRIIYDGFPHLTGTLLEQRDQAKRSFDHIRRMIMLEPRGHFDMYGALLRPHTELTESGEAHMGVLFMHNDGFSTMCGHATIALGRFLVDSHDPSIFSKRTELEFNPEDRTVEVNLHAPCGLIKVTVPVNEDGSESDPQRPVSFISTPSYIAAKDVSIAIVNECRWPELPQHQHSVKASLAFGGAFYCIVSVEELGFSTLCNPPLEAISTAVLRLLAAIRSDESILERLRHPESPGLQFLYGVIVADAQIGGPLNHGVNEETGLCFFADHQIDRSPTGSGVAARMALGYGLGSGQEATLKMEEKRTYHSLVSHALKKECPFVGTLLSEEEVELPHLLHENAKRPAVRVQVEGYAFYTGSSTMIVEPADPLGTDGFSMRDLGMHSS